MAVSVFSKCALGFLRFIEQQLFIWNGCKLGGDMVRKLSLMLVLTLGLVPLAAQALGLGDIKLNSALNQKFNAEIKLMSLSKGEIHDVRVNMASDEAFKRSGVDRTFLLTTLRFKPEQKPDGTNIIRITTDEPIREPFLNFLIEVNWPKGRLVREYTVLLDPPVTLERKPAPVQAPIQAPKAVKEPAAPAEAAPVIQSPPVSDAPYTGDVDELKVQNNQSLWVIARKHQHKGVDHTRMMMAIYNANPNAFIKSNINRLKKGAILRIPEKKDVLKLGVREAQSEYKRHVDEWQADRLGVNKKDEPEIAADTEQEQDDIKAEEKISEEPKAEEAKEETELKAEAGPTTDEEKPAEAAKKATSTEETKAEEKVAQESKAEEEMSVPGAELKIATARPEGKGEAGPSEDESSEKTVARLKQELLILEESAESVRGENEELSSRVTDLEDQLKDLERILELKNKQFATLQAALAKSKKEQILLAESQKQQEAKEEQKPEVEAVKEEQKPEMEAVKEEPKEEKKPEAVVAKVEPKDVTKPEAVVTKEEPKEEAKVQQKQPEPTVEVVKPKPVVEPVKQDSVVKPLPEDTKQPAKVVVTTPKEESEPSLLGAIVTSPTLLGLAIAVILIPLALVWMLMSRKRTNTADFQESILLNTIDDEVESSTLNEANNIPAHTEETSFLSDFSPSDIDALQDETGEVDPLSEADVYIAYGRYQQAEELIRQAIDKEPERDALKHKLFEILYATKDSNGFVKLVEEASGTAVETNDNEAWQRVLSMGKMLLPSHPKFTDAAEISADDDLFSLDDDLLEEDLGESDFADLDETLTQAEFGGGAGAKPSTTSEQAETDEGKLSDDTLDFSNDLDDTGAGLEDLDFESNMDEDFISAALDELEELDETLVTPEDGKKQASTEDDSDDEFTLTLSDLEDEGEKTILSLQDELSSEESGASAELENLDAFSLPEEDVLANELEETSLDIPDTESEEGDSELVSLGDLDVDLSISEDTPDEIATKIDLAQAYIEMGDKDGALDILDEVLNEGDATQKEKAQKIKDSIS